MSLEQTDPQLADLIKKEETRQSEVINLVASENYVSQAVREASASVLTNKYAEGYPGKRYYGGTKYIDEVEQLAVTRAKKLFGAEHVNIQPYSGTNPNLAVYFAVLEPGDRVLAMDLAAGGHLSHGSPMSISGKLFSFSHYSVNKETEILDYEQIEKQAQEVKPKLIVAGASAYSRLIDYKRFREIADKVGALLLVDMAHISGLVAAGVVPSPVPFADFVTSSTHKSLRGPRGGFIVCKEEWADNVDKALFPGLQGGPIENLIAAKAVAFQEATTAEFKIYSQQVVKNSKALCESLEKAGFKIVSGGTDNHLFNIDFGADSLTGKEAEGLLEEVGIVVNREVTPFDTRKPYIASGIRLGTPAVTTRGMKEEEMRIIAGLIARVLQSKDSTDVAESVLKLASQFPGES